MHRNLADLRLDDYQPKTLDFDCRRCQRQATAATSTLKAKYGNPTLGELARRIAADGSPPCNLAGVEGNVFCGVLPIEPDVETWAHLMNAKFGGWVGWLHCERHHAGLKAAKACARPFRVDIQTLMATLPWDFPLERLPTRLQCPDCGTKSIRIQWDVPDPAPDPEPVARPVFGRPGTTITSPAKVARSRGLRVAKGRAP